MVGARRVHGRVLSNPALELGLALKGPPCQVFQEGMKLQIADDTVLYPDLFVTCDKGDLATGAIFRAPVDWGAVAIVRRSLGVVIEASGLRVEWQHRPLEGGWLREVGIRLSTGRCAYLDETPTAPAEFTLHLVASRDQFFFREDFDEVRQFLELADEEVVVLTGQVRWWKKKAPAPSTQVRRRARVPPPSRVAEKVMTMTELADALKSHAGTFECQAIGDPTRSKQVAFRHLVTAPASNQEGLPSLGGLAAFFAVFGSVDLYYVEASGESAKRIASPADWPGFAGRFRDWLQQLAGPGRNDSLSDWVDDCLVIGEEPHSGNFLVVPCAGNAAGAVHEPSPTACFFNHWWRPSGASRRVDVGMAGGSSQPACVFTPL
jgi:hypothetical protein